MKQIFDWLREQINKHKDYCEINENGSRYASDSFGYESRVSAYNIVLNIINEAETKWEKDCCEWEHRQNYANCFCKCNGIMVEHDWAIGFKFCPYCGKRIKILEVE